MNKAEDEEVIGEYLVDPSDVTMEAKHFKEWVDEQVEKGCTHFSYQLQIIMNKVTPWGMVAYRSWSERERKEYKIKQLEAEIAQLKEGLENE